MVDKKHGDFEPLAQRTATESFDMETVDCPICGCNQGEVRASGPDYHYGSSPDTFVFMECSGCGMWRLNPRPAANALTRLYPDNYYSYDEEKHSLTSVIWDYLERKKIKKYLEMITSSPCDGEQVVFEIGCGSGRLLGLLRKELPDHWRIQGADLDRKAVRVAEAREGVEVFTSKFEELGIAAGCLDMIISQQVIEHVSNPQEVIAEAYRCLKPGGILILETPNVEGFDRKLFAKSLWGGYHFPRHFTLFSPKTLDRLVRECGFTKSMVKPMLSVTFWVVTLRNYLTTRPVLNSFLFWVHQRNPLCLGVATIIELMAKVIGLQSSNMAFIALVGNKKDC